MSQDPDESGIVPDDRLLVRPYFAHSGPPSAAAEPDWPQSGPSAFPGPAPAWRAAPASAPAPVRATARDDVDAEGGRGRRGGSRLPLTVLTLLGLAAVGALVPLLSDPEPEPDRPEPATGLSVPALPARSPGAGEEPTPRASVRSGTPSASPSAPSGTPATPSPKPSTPAARPSAAFTTLRMGDRGPEVRALQEMLYGQGFTYVAVTGVFDSQTKRGVSQLQRDRSIKGDPPGVYGPATQAALE
ncbi:peptidoglycan-binding domain-containing protein [Streptomyces sp. NPDC023588]|uniref:peptidoglycan-binding domain-containing protein n=1 Tax=Streptomyces sp. NPDC023588 TaxID=3154907 RepID=UPI003404253D